MEVYLTPDQLAVVEGLVASGRFRSVDEAVAEGVRMLASAERLRDEVEKGIQQAERGELEEHDTVFARLKTLAGSSQADRD
jgi:putative addiction module CopG family antidote